MLGGISGNDVHKPQAPHLMGQQSYLRACTASAFSCSLQNRVAAALAEIAEVFPASRQHPDLWTTSGSPGWIEWTLWWAFLALKLTCQFRTSVNLPISRHQCLFCKSSQLPLLLQRTLMWTSSNRHCDVKACQHSFTSSRKLLQWLGWFKPAGCGFVELFVLAGNMSGNYTRLIDYCRHRGMVVESPGKNF